MKKEMTYSLSNPGTDMFRGFSAKSIKNSIAKRVLNSQAVTKLAALYSRLLEEPVSSGRALRFLHASLAFSLLICFSGNLLAVFLFGIWTFAACRSCRKHD